MKKYAALSAFAFWALSTSGCDRQDGRVDTASQALLSRAIEYYDPAGVWGESTVHIKWFGTGADGSQRSDLDLTLYPDGSKFDLRGRYAGADFEYHTDGSTWTATVNGDSSTDVETRKKMRLDREDGFYWRSYYGFLTGLPMKLRDPGTHIDPALIDTMFNGQPALALHVTYDPEIGTDSWYFFFDPETTALIGCRFNHDETKNDGEYIVLEGVVESNGLRVPRRRSWYTNKDDRFLGSDEIRSIALLPGP
ncbi:MAG: DUF6503 family protein [Gemmatimonadales bacterium]